MVNKIHVRISQMSQLLVCACFDWFPMPPSISSSTQFSVVTRSTTKIPQPSVYAPKSKSSCFRRKQYIQKVESRFLIHGKNYFCHCCSSIHMLQTTATKRPPTLTLTGARIFKQRLATIRKHCIGSDRESGARSQEPGARSQEPESSEQNSVENMTFRHSLR